MGVLTTSAFRRSPEWMESMIARVCLSFHAVPNAVSTKLPQEQSALACCQAADGFAD